MWAGMTGAANAGDAGTGHDHTATRRRTRGDHGDRIGLRCSARSSSCSFERSDECPVRIRAILSPTFRHRVLKFIGREHPGDLLVQKTLRHDSAHHSVGCRRRGIVPAIEAHILGDDIEHGERIPEVGDLGFVEESRITKRNRHVVDRAVGPRTETQHLEQTARSDHRRLVDRAGVAAEYRERVPSGQR